MLKYFNQFKPDQLSASQALLISAVVLGVQSGAMVTHLIRIANVVGENENRAAFLLDIVSRNMDNLEEFDLIALREMGMLKETVD